MPNKTIYVADDDLPVFQRAQELVGGNLSSTVVSALRRLIELEEGREAGFEEITLQVGRDGVRQVRFQGTLLGEWRDADDKQALHQAVYRSRKGKLVLYTHSAKWEDYPTGEAAGEMKEWKYWRRMFGIGNAPWDWGDYDYEILDDLKDLKDRVPDKLYRKVEDMTAHPKVEELDI
ncbi:EXLDI protein [Nocardia sp. NPDC058658]|uniref:EXLDI protein n=1 Tax=Nocardia sp. NPDC058658 TaxID=3346580 RepID=UPI00364F83B2